MSRRFADTVLPPVATFLVTTARGGDRDPRGPRLAALASDAVSGRDGGRARTRRPCCPRSPGPPQAVAIGLSLSIAVGLVVAIALSASRWVERAFYPYAIFFQIVPIVAIAPLLVIWFGYGLRAVVAAAFIVSVFPVIANTLAGLHVGRSRPARPVPALRRERPGAAREAVAAVGAAERARRACASPQASR